MLMPYHSSVNYLSGFLLVSQLVTAQDSSLSDSAILPIGANTERLERMSPSQWMPEISQAAVWNKYSMRTESVASSTSQPTISIPQSQYNTVPVSSPTSMSSNIAAQANARFASAVESRTSGRSAYDKVVIAHATIGSITWMLLSPCAIVIARKSTSSLRSPSVHRWLQILLTGSLTIVTVALGGLATNLGQKGAHFVSAHHRMGLVLLLLLVLQLLLGLFTFSRFAPKRRSKPLFNYIHIGLGVSLSYVGFSQIYLGLMEYQKRSGRPIHVAVRVIWALIVATFSLYLISAAVIAQRKKSRRVRFVDEQQRESTVSAFSENGKVEKEKSMYLWSEASASQSANSLDRAMAEHISPDYLLWKQQLQKILPPLPASLRTSTKGSSVASSLELGEESVPSLDYDLPAVRESSLPFPVPPPPTPTFSTTFSSSQNRLPLQVTYSAPLVTIEEEDGSSNVGVGSTFTPASDAGEEEGDIKNKHGYDQSNPAQQWQDPLLPAVPELIYTYPVSPSMSIEQVLASSASMERRGRSANRSPAGSVKRKAVPAFLGDVKIESPQ